jgi:hypothetical protein
VIAKSLDLFNWSMSSAIGSYADDEHVEVEGSLARDLRELRERQAAGGQVRLLPPPV